MLCDLDGTLIDSAPDLAEALSDMLAGAGRRRVGEDEVKAMVGDGVAVLVERGFAATGGLPGPEALDAHVARYIALYESRLTARTRLYPGALKALGVLAAQGWRLAICTNKPERASREIVAALGLGGLIEALAGGDTYPVKKPHPGHLLRLLETMGAAPGQAVMLGDSINDTAAARAAGIPAIAVSYGYGAIPAHELGAERVIDHLDDLPDALAGLITTAS